MITKVKRMEKQDNPKVLIGCVTDGSQQFCLDSFWKAIQKQDFRGADVLFIDSSDDSKYQERLEKTGARVMKQDAQDHRIKTVVESRKKIKEIFLKQGYDYLLFVEPDIILPANAVSRLLFHRKDLISGVYLSNMKLGESYELCPTLYDFADEGFVRVMEMREIIEDRLLEISCAGLGCAMISREVMECVDMRFFERSMAGDNVALFTDARAREFEAFADTSVKCNRMVRPEGDPLNNVFSFDAYPKIRGPKVLVGCVTYDKDELHLKGLLDAIRSQDYRNHDIIFADTSGKDEFHAELKGTGAIVIKGAPELDHTIKKITDGRQRIRDYAIEKGYDYLWFVDTDVVPPPTALSKLLSDRKDVVAGLYLLPRNFNGISKILPIVQDFADEEGYCRPMGLTEVLNDNVIEVSCAGFGCTLATREVLEKVDLRYFEKSMAGEDTAFFVDVREAGFRTFADNSVKCAHRLFPPGDPRNRKLMFESYMKGTDYSIKVDNISKD
jgi:hypothetical protein